MIFWKEIFWEQDHSEVKTMIAENRNFSDGLEDKVEDFSETGKPKKKKKKKEEEEAGVKRLEIRGPVLEK